MTVRELTSPPYEPITRAQAKAWCRVDSDITTHDTVIDLLVKAMRRHAENLTGRVFVPRTFQLVESCVHLLNVNGVPRNGFCLPYPPLISVESITYLDTNGDQQTLAASQYNVHTWKEPGFVVEDWDVTWPSFRREPDAWRVNFTAGYSPGSPADEQGYQDSLPETLKLWMQARISTLFENREQLIVGAIVEKIPHDFTDGLLDELMVGSRMFS